MRKWLPLVAVCAGTFMLLVDATIVNVALPDMARGLHASFADLQWVISLYALVLAALVLTAGSVADRIGRRSIFLGGLTVFACSSLLCGLSPNVDVLIAARGIQGVGAAAMLATTMALISSSYSGRDVGVAFGIWGAVNGGAAAAGPLIGGLLATWVGWRWIFFVNLPVCVVAVAMTLLVVRESRAAHTRRVDLPGMACFTVAAATLVCGLIRGSWESAGTIGLFVVSAVALVFFVLVEHLRRDPMLDLSLLRNPSFGVLLVAVALLPAAAWGAMAYQSLWFQSVLGLHPIQAGLLLLPCGLGTFGVSIAIGRVLHAVSPRLLIGSGLVLVAMGALAQAVISDGSGWAVEIPGLLVVGLGAGLVLAPLSATAMAAVPRAQAGLAGGAVNAFRQLGLTFAVMVLGQVFHAGLSATAGENLAEPLSSGQAGAAIASGSSLLVHRAFATGLDLTYLVAAGFGIAAAILVFVFVRPARDSSPARTSASRVSKATIPDQFVS